MKGWEGICLQGLLWHDEYCVMCDVLAWRTDGWGLEIKTYHIIFGDR